MISLLESRIVGDFFLFRIQSLDWCCIWVCIAQPFFVWPIQEEQSDDGGFRCVCVDSRRQPYNFQPFTPAEDLPEYTRPRNRGSEIILRVCRRNQAQKVVAEDELCEP